MKDPLIWTFNNAQTSVNVTKIIFTHTVYYSACAWLTHEHNQSCTSVISAGIPLQYLNTMYLFFLSCFNVSQTLNYKTFLIKSLCYKSMKGIKFVWMSVELNEWFRSWWPFSQSYLLKWRSEIFKPSFYNLRQEINETKEKIHWSFSAKTNFVT